MKKLLIGLIIIVILLMLASYFYLQGFKPNYNENINLDRLNASVECYYDGYGIPHIYADTDADAYRTLGYVHAKDRLWQMELIRRIAPGRLSEVFGENLVDTDKFFKMLGISQYSEESLKYFNKGISSEIRENVLAYIDGINQYIDQGHTPLEYKIVGLEMTPFSPLDIYNTIGYMAFSFAIAHETDPIATYILEEHGLEYLDDLDLHVDTATTMIRSGIGSNGLEDLSVHMSRLKQTLPIPQLVGSNSWVIAGEKTKSGKVIFANDPHIGFSSPSVWYEAEINTLNTEHYGFYLAGYPFPQLMHNNHHAIGLTMLENDDIDFYREKVNPDNSSQYLFKNEWKEFKSRTETIRVKDGEDVIITVRSTIHGPVMNDVVSSIQTDSPVSLWWTYFKHTNKTIDASYIMSSAKSMEEARAGAAMIHSPGLNVMYGDVDGNIAWWPAARLVKRPEHVNSKLILDGASGNDEPLGYYDFSENPKAENPEMNYVYSANNQPVRDGFEYYPGYYVPEDRARRIVKLLESKNDWTVDEVKEMMIDIKSENSPEIAKSMILSLDRADFSEFENTTLDILKTWDGNYNKESKAPLIYNKMLYHVVRYAMSDELGDELFDTYNGTHLMKRSIQPMLANENSVWWDDLNTSDTRESKADIVSKAFETTLEELITQFSTNTDNWQWGNAHTIEHGHSFQDIPVLKKYFNVGPFEVAGNNETINNFMYRLEDDGTYEVQAGPSTRRIVDFNDIKGNSWSILPTGESGNVMSPHYRDQAEMHANGEFRRVLTDKNQVIETSKNKSVFTPGN